MALLVLRTAPQFLRAQENTVASPQSSAASTEMKQRSASETRKHLQKLACGPSNVDLTHHAEKRPEQALPEQPPEKGLIYVIRTNNLVGAANPARLAMDGKWVGINRLANFFYFEADPGPHYFCVDSGGQRGLLSMVIEKGKTYYLQQKLTMAGPDIDIVDEQKGKKYVAKFSRSTFEERRK